MKNNILFYFGHVLLIGYLISVIICHLNGINHLLLAAAVITYVVALGLKNIKAESEYNSSHIGVPYPIQQYKPPIFIHISNMNKKIQHALISTQYGNSASFNSNNGICLYCMNDGMSMLECLTHLKNVKTNHIEIFSNNSLQFGAPVYFTNVDDKNRQYKTQLEKVQCHGPCNIFYDEVDFTKDTDLEFLLLAEESIIVKIYPLK